MSSTGAARSVRRRREKWQRWQDARKWLAECPPGLVRELGEWSSGEPMMIQYSIKLEHEEKARG